MAETNPGSGARTRSYTYLPGIDRPQSLVLADGTTYYYGMEEPGHVAGVMTSAGAGAASYEYTPFGERLSATGSLNQPLQFMGRERDEAGYYYVRARWYDPTLERFVSEDPIGLAGGINPYAYVSNDPINAMDPLGLSPGAAYDLPTVYTIDCPAGQRYDVWFVCQDVTSGTARSPSTRGMLPLGLDLPDVPDSYLNGYGSTDKRLADREHIRTCSAAWVATIVDGAMLFPYFKGAKLAWASAKQAPRAVALLRYALQDATAINAFRESMKRGSVKPLVAFEASLLGPMGFERAVTGQGSDGIWDIAMSLISPVAFAKDLRKLATERCY